MKIVTWNVNSIRARLGRTVAWLNANQPDVLCLQELKVADEAFPIDAIKEAGYFAAFHGQKTYNGVAILAKSPPADVRIGLDDGIADDHARFITAMVNGVRIISAYFPNGGEVGGPKYPYKLAWMERVRHYLDRHHDPDEKLALCGDYNVAVDDLDVNFVVEWNNTTLTSDDVRIRLANIANFGLVDTFRKHHPEGKIFSWWDYRGLGFQKNNGLRIDHIFATESLAVTSVAASVDRDERKGEGASDHAPVIVEFDV